MSGIRRWFRVGDVERDVDEEIGLYFEESVRDLEAQGLTPEDARREAERRFGDSRSYRRAMLAIDSRAAARARWSSRVEAVRDVLRQSVRSVVRAPSLTIGIVLAFALGLGANATMYEMVERLLLRPPPHVEEPEDVRRLFVYRDNGFGSAMHSTTVAYPDYLDFARTSGFAQVAAMSRATVTLGSGLEAEPAHAVFVQAGWWELLGVKPAVGRFFTAEEDRFGGARVAVLSHRQWQSRYGGSAEALGQEIDFGYGPFTIIGVAPKGFTGIDLARVDFFAPFMVAGELMQGGTDWASQRNWYWLRVVARLAPGVATEAAESEATTHHRAGRAETERYDRNARVVAAPLLLAQGPDAPSEVALAGWLLGVALIVLAIACLNVANLLLARMLRQRRELSIRLALGISRRRLVTQIFAEGVLLGLLGGAAALLLNAWGGTYVQRTLLPDVEWGSSVSGTVIGAVALLSVLAGLLSAIAPAVQTSAGSVLDGLRTASGGITRSTARVRASLSVVQAALSIVLLVGAGLFVRSLHEVRTGDFGLDPWNVVYFSPVFYGNATVGDDDRLAWDEQALARIARVGGVEAASSVAGVPFWTAYAYPLRVPGLDSVPRTTNGAPLANLVGADYFRVLRLDVRRGRTFDERDTHTATPVVALSESFAEALWPGQDPLGRCIHIGETSSACVEVVGVVEDASRNQLMEGVTYQYYLPMSQRVVTRRPDGLLVRLSGDAPAVTAAVQRELLATDDRVRYVRSLPLEEMLAPELRQWQLGATLFTLFGALALIVAALGLYSVLAFDVAQRVREIGLRSALGATTQGIVRIVVGRALRITLLGIAIGGGTALVLAPQLQGMLYKIDARDPLTFGIAAITLGVVAALASGLPALRAARVDPNIALRAD